MVGTYESTELWKPPPLLYKLLLLLSSLVQICKDANSSRVLNNASQSSGNVEPFGKWIVAKLAEILFPTPEVRSSNPVYVTNYIEHLFTAYCTTYWNDESEKHGQEMADLKII